MGQTKWVPDTSYLRRDYGSGQLDDSAVAGTWREQFEGWFAEASGLDQPQAGVLATADAAGRPRARTVLIKSWDDDGFVWATNYESRKGRDLAVNPYAGLCFSWIALERQVHVEGPVERCSAAESDEIFRARPRGAQLAAWASPQSETLPAGRAELDQRLAEVSARFEGTEVTRPQHWGGYRLRPESVEFWQGRPNRLHDRVRFSSDPAADRQGNAATWLRERLGP
jgi:pyridoxamine 5'-phosphate oxidase